MKIVLGADSPGKPLLDVIAAHLAGKPHLEVADLGQPGYYAHMADRAASAVASGERDRASCSAEPGSASAYPSTRFPALGPR